MESVGNTVSPGSLMENITLSLRPWPTRSDQEESLRSIIDRINDQRGHFRNVTEDSLKAEISALEAGRDVMETDNGKKLTVDNEDNQKKELQAAKQELSNFVRLAQNFQTIAMGRIPVEH